MQFQSKWNLELSISINEIHLKINTICQIIKKQFSKASVKGRGKKWTLWIINAYVIFPLTMFPQISRHCVYTNLFLNGSRIKLLDLNIVYFYLLKHMGAPSYFHFAREILKCHPFQRECPTYLISNILMQKLICLKWEVNNGIFWVVVSCFNIFK